MRPLETIGKYKITGELGHGGFGHVYKAEDPTFFGRTVAIKVLNVQNDEAMIRRFRAEARTSANLRHKNIVTVLDFEEENGMQYLVMEYLDGLNLQQLLDQHAPIPILDKLSIMAEVAEGLQYAHEQGVVHRDVKPANIMQLKDGSVKIMDFGIARLTQTSTRLTQAGYMVGTPQYMAPEQFLTDGADAQCDIWAFGVVLYEFLTGKNPFIAENAVNVIYRITREDPPPICDSVAGLPRSLDPVVRRLLAKNKEERYPSLEDLRLDLGPVIQELGKAQVAGMEDTVETLIRTAKYEEALAVAARILKFDLKNTKARKWRTELRDKSRKQLEEARVKELLDEAEAQTGRMDYASAEARLKEALQIDPENNAARTRLDQVYVERDKKARAKALLSEAQTDFDRQSLTSAFERANEAAQADPSSSEAVEFLARVRQAVAARDAEARRRTGLGKARGLLLVEDYDGAVTTLQELTALYPTDAEVAARLVEALRLQAVDATEKRVAAAIAKSRDYLLKGDLQDAIDLLSGLDPDAARNPQVQQLLNYASEQREQQKRDAEVEQLLDSAAALKGDYDRALSSIARALDLSPGNEKALRLRKTVLATRQRDEENKALETELNGCRELMAADRLEDAQTRARALFTRHPDHPGTQQVIRDLGQRFQQREEALDREIESRKLEVELMLDRGHVEGALSLLQTLSTRYQRENAFTDLKQRATRLDSEKRERDTVASILTRSKSLGDAARWDDARAALDQGLKQFPKSGPLLAERERVVQQADLQAAVNDIQQKISRQDLDSAMASAESNIRKFPGDTRLVELLQKARGEREWKELLRRAESLILAGQIEEANKAVAELTLRGRTDAALSRLQRMLEEKQKRSQNLAAAEQLRKRFAFQQARDVLQGILREDRDDAAAQALLDAVDRDSADYNRRQRVSTARTEATRRSKSKDYAGAVQILTNIANEYPDDVEIQDDLRHARDSRDQNVRKEAYSNGCQEFDSLMRARQFDQAIAKAKELIAAFPNETDLLEDLRHATEARDQAVRKDAYANGRRDLTALLKERKFDQAIAKAKELIAAFPTEADLQDDLRRATEARDQAVRRDAYAGGRKDLAALLRDRKFDQALKKVEELIVSFPEEPELQDDLRRVREARDQAARKQAFAAGRREVDAFIKNRQSEQAIARLRELAAAFPEEPELQDELHRVLEDREEAVRKEAYSRGRKEFDALMKSRQFEEAVARAEELIRAFPKEPELEDDLKRARAARDQTARKEAYTQSRKELDGLIKGRQFDMAVAKGTALIAAFPDEPELQDDLARARQGRDQAARKEAYARSRNELIRLMKDRQFEQAIAAAQILIANYPDEPELQDTLRRAREGLDQANRKGAYARGRKELEELVRNRKFEQAVSAAEQLIAAFPEEPELHEDLRRAREARDQAARKEAYARGRQQIEAFMRGGQFDRAAASAQQMIAAFPEEPELQEDLRRARETRDHAARTEAYTRGRQEFESLMRNRQLERAVTKAEELLAAFPAEPVAPDDLKRAREALAQATRKTLYDRGRKEFDGLMRNRQFEQAIAKAQELAVAFPEESIAQDDLKRAVEARDKAARKLAYDQRRNELDALMKAGQFAEAIGKAEALAKEYPEDPVIQQDLQAAKSAKEVRDRGKELEARVAELEALRHKGDIDAVRKGAQALLKQYNDPRAKEFLRWANQSGTNLKAIKIDTAAPRDYKRILIFAVPVAIALLFVGIYALIHGSSGEIHANPQELSFTYQLGRPAPDAQSFEVATGGKAWTIKPSDPWFSITPAAQTGKATVSVGVATDGLGVGDYTGIATITAKDGSASPVTVRVKLKVLKAPSSAGSSATIGPSAKSTQPSNQSLPAAQSPPGTQQTPSQSKLAAAPMPAVVPSEPKPAEIKPPNVKPPETKSTAAVENKPVVNTQPPPTPLEPAVDCHSKYTGLNSGAPVWRGVLQPKESVVIDRHSRTVSGAPVTGNLIPGCPVNIEPVPNDGTIVVTSPAEGDNFGRAVIKNNSDHPVSGPGFKWTVK